MTKGQIAQLRDLQKCYVGYPDVTYVENLLAWSVDPGICLTKDDKAWLRRMTHQYRNQIKAIRRNQERATLENS